MNSVKHEPANSSEDHLLLDVSMSESTEMDVNNNNVIGPQNSKSRRLRSDVWNHFTKEQREDGSYVAICHHCQKQLTACSRSGTTHLKNHFGICTSGKQIRRKKLVVRRVGLESCEAKYDGAGNLEHPQFDQELSRRDLARMIILEGYTFDMINHNGFRTFVRNLQPRFKFVGPDTIKVDCMKIYTDARLKLHEALDKFPCQVSIMVDMWRSSEDVEYMCITCQFVDDNWSLKRKILNFSHVEAASSSQEISKAIAEKLQSWNVDRKLSSIVLDNCSDNDMVAREILKFLRLKGISVNDDLFHVGCCSFVLNLIAQDGLETACEITNLVRDSVRYVKSSQERLRRFNKAAKQVGSPKKLLLLDVPNSWNSTYLMLESACELQDAFTCLAELDSEYKNSPSSKDWNDVKAVIECLEEFSNTIYRFSHTRIPTANICFNDICGIHLVLKRWSASTVPVAGPMASRMFEKFEQYWGITGKVMAIASVLDPRYKMKSVEYFFKLIYDDPYEANERIGSIRKILLCFYNEYIVQSMGTSKHRDFLCFGRRSSADTSAECGTDGESKTSSRITLSDAQRGLGQYLQEASSSQPFKSDLDMYLEESVHPPKEDFDDSFSILAWWKLNAAKYPVLSMMARDMLGIPLSVVALDYEGRKLDQNLSSMDSTTVEGLICAQDWLRDEFEGGHAEVLSIDPVDANMEGDIDECMTPTNGEEFFLS